MKTILTINYSVLVKFKFDRYYFYFYSYNWHGHHDSNYSRQLNHCPSLYYKNNHLKQSFYL